MIVVVRDSDLLVGIQMVGFGIQLFTQNLSILLFCIKLSWTKEIFLVIKSSSHGIMILQQFPSYACLFLYEVELFWLRIALLLKNQHWRGEMRFLCYNCRCILPSNKFVLVIFIKIRCWRKNSPKELILFMNLLVEKCLICV